MLVRQVPPRKKERKKVELTEVRTDKYISQKGNIVGPSWKIPFIGPFLESVNPEFTKYHAKWMSGPLSCVSVFHK